MSSSWCWPNSSSAGWTFDTVTTSVNFESEIINGKFEGNEDFGREYHQLYFGILGAYDDAYTGEHSRGVYCRIVEN